MTMTTRELGRALTRPRSPALPEPRLRPLLARLSAMVAAWRRRLAERALLARMDEREIRDLGITVSDVMIEINKPFWRD